MPYVDKWRCSVSQAMKAKYLLCFSLFNLGTYFLIQQFVSHEHNFLTDLDRAIPFMPDFVWIYHTLLPGIVGTMFLLVKSRNIFLTTFWAGVLATVIIHIIYILFPSFYPRPDLIPSTLSEELVALSYLIDNSSNTFPSGHVAFSWLMFWGAMFSKKVKETMGLRRLYLLWALGVSMSTLAIKMHYIIDVIGGFCVAAFCFFLVKYIVTKYNLFPDK